ncbi:hypothetical protein CT43_CH4283 [Bacillus thuringiensis serovar chinensis CT-43]|nr:hypothetical protein CT43_CH4283 [Bacillus thuringiensis serovar chinensis CT-43]
MYHNVMGKLVYMLFVNKYYLSINSKRFLVVLNVRFYRWEI